MYHPPKLCRTCLQVSRGDFKFVSLDYGDTEWNSNSPNLKEQLIAIVPEMKIEASGTYICTSCFIALRTAYEFKMMCQVTEQKFHNYDYKYRRSVTVGPGSVQFHVSLNENSNDTSSSSATTFPVQNLSYLQTDTTIDITEHHLYDASQISRQQFHANVINNVTQKLPEIDMEVVTPRKTAEDRIDEDKKLNSVELRRKYNIGSEISILKNGGQNGTTVKKSFSLMKYLKNNKISPKSLTCNVRLRSLTPNYVKHGTNGKYSLTELKAEANSYYYNKLEQYLSCHYCSKTFSTRIALQLHEETHAPTKHLRCSRCDLQFLYRESLRRHLRDYHNIVPVIRPALRIKTEPKLPDNSEEALDSIKISDQTTLIRLRPEQAIKSEKKYSSSPIHTPHRISVKSKISERKAKIIKSEIISTDTFDGIRIAEQFNNRTRKHISKTKITKVKKTPIIIKQEFYKPLQTSTPISKKPVKIFKKSKPNVKHYKCLICQKVCISKMQLMKHQSFSHIPSTSSRYWSNTLAKIRLEKETSRDYCLKLRTRKPNNIIQFRCYICDKSFSDENFLNLHLYCHVPVIFSPESISGAEDGPEIFICYICDKGFPRERYLKLHNLQVHLCKTATCKKCRREFKSEFWFNRHRCELLVENPVALADDRGPFVCKLCNRSFAKMRFIKNHWRRMHVDIALKDVVIIKSTDSVNIDNLDLDDPMKLYAISNNSKNKGAEEISEDEKGAENSNDNKETEESKKNKVKGNFYPNPFAANARRKSIQRSMPKIQCDFCGEYIEENRYDKHIYEHNKIRFQKITRRHEASDESTLEDILDKNKVTMKCHICFKVFQRKYYLDSHINKHLKEDPSLKDLEGIKKECSQVEDDSKSEDCSQQDEEEEGEDDEERELKPYEINLQIANTSDVYKCCDKTFKMKAHFFRHYKMRHGAYTVTNPYNKSVKIKQEYSEEVNEDNNTDRYFTRKGTPKHYGETKDEEKSDTTFKDASKVNSNKRKSEDEDNLTNANVKKPNLETDKTDYEFVKHKRIKSEPEEATVSYSKRRISTSTLMDDFEQERSLRYQCLICDKRFRQKCQLRDHSNVHTGAKPYICEFCVPPRGFTQTSSLYVHFRRVHAAVVKHCVWEVYSKNGACLTCSELFEKHSVMFRHVKDQYMEKAFNCHVCMKKFNMVCHYKSHGIIPEEMRLILMQNQSDEEEDEEEEEGEEQEQEEGEQVETEEEQVETEEVENYETEKEPNVDSEMDSLGDANKLEEKSKIECRYCNRTFMSKQQLKFHRKSLAHIQQVQSTKNQENPENEDDSNMDGFSENLDTIADIKNNCKAIMQKLNNMKRKKHQCPVCNMCFVKKIHLKKHKRKMHRAVRKRKTGVNKVNEISEPEDSIEGDPEQTDNADNEKQSIEGATESVIEEEIDCESFTIGDNEGVPEEHIDKEKPSSLIGDGVGDKEGIPEEEHIDEEKPSTIIRDSVDDVSEEERIDKEKPSGLIRDGVDDNEGVPEEEHIDKEKSSSVIEDDNQGCTLQDTMENMDKEQLATNIDNESNFSSAVRTKSIDESCKEEQVLESNTLKKQATILNVETTNNQQSIEQDDDVSSSVTFNYDSLEEKKSEEFPEMETMTSSVSEDVGEQCNIDSKNDFVGEKLDSEEQCNIGSKDDFVEEKLDSITNMIGLDKETEKQTLLVSPDSTEHQTLLNTSSHNLTNFGLNNITSDVSLNQVSTNDCILENNTDTISDTSFNYTNEAFGEEKELVNIEKNVSRMESLESVHIKDM